MRLLRYMARIWERQLTEEPRARAFHPIIPVLLHHGPRAWPWPTRFRDCFAGGSALHRSLAPHLIDFDFVLDDLVVRTDEQLLSRSMGAVGRLALIALRNARSTPFLAGHFAAVLRTLRDGLREPQVVPALAQLVRNVLTVGEGKPEPVRALLVDALPTQHRSDVMSTADLLRAEGRTEGRTKGRLEARRESLLEFLESRFGSVSATARLRIAQASLETLVRWIRSGAVARTLEDVFAE